MVSREMIDRGAAVAAEPAAAGPSPRIRALLEAYGDHPSIGLALGARMEHFTDDGVEGVVAYRRAGRWLFQFGGAFGPPGDRAVLLDRFLEFARDQRLDVCAVQLRDGDVDLYHRHGFRLNQLGRSYTLDLRGFDTKGGRFMKLRNKIARARRSGLEVYEIGRDVPRTPGTRAELDAITTSWLRAKGRFKKLLDFLVNDLDVVDRPGTRVFVARQEGRSVAFIAYVPSYGRYAGLMHDLTRRVPDAPPGVMELINLTAIERFKAEGLRYLNFGLTPFAGVEDRLGSHSRVVSTIVRLLDRHGEAIYPAASQVAYKMKWDLQIIEPEYLAFRGWFRMSCLWQLLRVTRSI